MRIFRYAKVLVLAPAVGSAVIGIVGLVAVGGLVIAGRGHLGSRTAGPQSASTGLMTRARSAGEAARRTEATVDKTQAENAVQDSVQGAIQGSMTRRSATGEFSQSNIEKQRAGKAARKQAEARLNFTKSIDSGRLAFLNDYAGRATNDADGKQKVKTLVDMATPYTPYHFGMDMPLPQVLDSLLLNEPQPVEIRDGRYATMSGIRIAVHNRAGLLWVDMREGIALGAIYFDPTNGEPSPTLTIFSRQLDQRTVRMSELPRAFVEDLSRWAATEDVPTILTRYFIGASGDKYVLRHEENYCQRSEGVARPSPKGVCEEMNAQAALIDLQATKFLDQTHNASNATMKTIASK